MAAYSFVGHPAKKQQMDISREEAKTNTVHACPERVIARAKTQQRINSNFLAPLEASTPATIVILYRDGPEFLD